MNEQYYSRLFYEVWNIPLGEFLLFMIVCLLIVNSIFLFLIYLKCAANPAEKTKLTVLILVLLLRQSDL